MSTILDALRKLQRERAAQAPDRDLRGSITHEANRGRRRGTGARNIGVALALLAIAGGGYVLYQSGQIQELLARFSSGGDDIATEEDFAAVEREMLEREAAAAQQASAQQAETTPPVAESPPTPAPVARLPRTPRNAPQPAVAGAPDDSPEILAERARLEAALANARAAQEAQAQAARDAQAAEQTAANPPAPEAVTDAGATAAPSAEAPVAPPTQNRVVAKRKPPAPPNDAAPVAKAPAAQPKPQAKLEREDAEPEARALPRAAADPTPSRAAFPDVWVESIRWHPIAERRVASLRFERQNAPEAREGDIVAGVLVYRIDPGSVELRVGEAQRTVQPGP